METNSSSTNLLSRSKKLPPPPLCLPGTTTTTDEDKNHHSNQQHEQKKSTNNCCSSSSIEDCPHISTTYILPAIQRPQILKTLTESSSVLLVPPTSETKHKKSFMATYANQINLLKQRQSSKMTINDAEWIDFMRLIVHKPLEYEIKSLLDKYKMTYFDRVNASNTADDTIRSSLCTIVSEALSSYSSSSILPSTTSDDSITNVSSPVPSTSNTNNGSAKRKRKHKNTSISQPAAPVNINNQTKFVISYIIPHKYENNSNDNKTINTQQKQFQKKYNHLFRYIPDKDKQEYLIREGHLKNFSTSSSQSPNNNYICLMLYDEVIDNIDDYDLELSGISIDDSFTLPESILTHIYSSIQ